MRKYLNKGLLYEWFTASKMPILIGLVTWGFIARRILGSYISIKRDDIAGAESNHFMAADLGDYFILGVIFLAIYSFASGVSKRNTTMFLCSGPFTKRQIKINELICLLITLGLFIIMYIYIAVTIYVKNNELMSIVNWYPQVILIEVVRLFLFGIIGILLMIEIDSLFSNSIIAYFGMIALGVATIVIIIKCRTIVSYFGSYGATMDKIFGNIVYGNSKRLSILFFGGPYYSGDSGIIFKGIIFSIVIIGVMLLIFNVLEKRAKLETINKIFSCKANENMIVVYLSVGIGSLINSIITSISIDSTVGRFGRIPTYTNTELMMRFAVDGISIVVITLISYKLFKKVLKMIG